jgi:hypothetical protein
MKKHLLPMEIHKAIRTILESTEGIVKGACNPNCFFYRRPTKKGFFTIKITTQCEGSVIGTFEIRYRPDKDMIFDEYDIHSGWICMNDKPENIVREILNHTNPDDVDDDMYNDVAFEIVTCPHCGNIVDGYTKDQWDRVNGEYLYNMYECDVCGLYFNGGRNK